MNASLLVPSFDGFDWDAANTYQCIERYPERQNSIEELESVFADSNLFTEADFNNPKTGEPTYLALGLSYKQRLFHLKFVVRHGKARIYHAYPTSKAKWRRRYQKGS